MSEKSDSTTPSKQKSATKSTQKAAPGSTAGAKKATSSKAPAKRPTRKAKSTEASKENAVRIEGQDYSLESLSGQARAQILNLRATDQRIEHLKQELLITQTARQAYAEALADELGASKDQTLQ